MLLKRITSSLLLLLIITFVASSVGATNSGNLLRYLTGDLSTAQAEIMSSIRLPRIATAILAGFLIGIAGATMQRVFGNPLAEPTLLGTTAAAALGSVLVILLGASAVQFELTLPGAFTVALLISALAVWLSDKTRLQGANFIIIGIATAALLNGIIATVAAVVGSSEIRAISFWSSGTLAFARSESVVLLGIITLLMLLALPALSNKLDLFVFNTVQLTLLGYAPRRLKLMALTLTSLAVSATVVSIGAVAFLGLAAPFIARFIFGESMKLSLFASGVIGATLLLVSDTIARSIAAPNEIPISVVTSLIGAPFLFMLILRNRVSNNA